ncbi:phosphate ABC transporter permease subunit PstC [Candidatus Liberibacter asiaticus]|uniref:phosphate ABC transporter permease subunit PstC n=1 Tax=Liberibacter asiaticus TaxID=34021 RepID=UPI0004E05E20|nr:phosphate ABC transporter permease subunit PstC [Candidatus Liberibacter asiaticus]MDI1493703.1 phosphate ABC transporter permease subunit PstC [Candidatus Liberibacter asiaticus]QYK84438.1 phosphate ABC transporter permease subunit PstC [Candidatus Liberibacter asiaticus]WCM58885.1 phosphate ABC transporter permease subunit PstC [Candidatus Liberibacter asiaticus]BAP26379.1 ABC transporter membrane spanning protein [Candidatus Liberibacter asiaticus str. Ishi-1]
MPLLSGFSIIFLGLVSYFLGCLRARFLSKKNAIRLYSKESYYGVYVALYSIIPYIFIFLLWFLFSPYIIDFQVSNSFSHYLNSLAEGDRQFSYSILHKIVDSLSSLDPDTKFKIQKGDGDISDLLRYQNVISGYVPSPWIIEAAFYQEILSRKSRILMNVCMFLFSFLGCSYAILRIKPSFCARSAVEKFIVFLLRNSLLLSIVISFGIIISLFANTFKFFSIISATDFFFGIVWDPRFPALGSSNVMGQFGLIPLLIGTFYIGFIAMLFSVPIGLLIAIYMAEYAPKKLRAVIKPITEMLVGIPTIVYGFFALSLVGPFLRDISIYMNGLITGNYKSFIEAQSVLTAGLVMGIMLIPYVSSLSEDVISSIPRSLRDGSLGLGATRSETMKYVIFPAAFPGIAGAILMTASRTIGETMIVVLAAGVAARLQFNPFESMTTITVKIMNQLTGDLDFSSPQTLVAFALGLTLFCITFFLNIYAMYIMKKYQRKYE